MFVQWSFGTIHSNKMWASLIIFQWDIDVKENIFEPEE